MSTRSRAAPWFLERPGIYAHVLYWMGEPLLRQWSWNRMTWFDYSGNVVGGGQRDHVLAQLDAQVPFAEVRMFDGADPFIGSVA